MIKDSITSSLEDIQLLSDTDKNKLYHYSNKALQSLKEEKGKANNITIVIGNEGGSIIELKKKRKRNRNYKTAEQRLKAIGIDESNENKLVERINKGELNNNHVTNIGKADMAGSLSQLPPEAQEKVIETIITNTNEKHKINSEVIAAEAIKSGNINLVTVENWYKGFLRSATQYEANLYINDEILEFLSQDQIKHLHEITRKLTVQCNNFIKNLTP